MTTTYGTTHFQNATQGMTLSASPPGGSSLTVTTTSADTTNEEFDRFADLTHKLVQVPKVAVGEKRERA